MSCNASDYISRYIIFDKAFSGGAHIDQHLFIFGEAKEGNRAHESAVARSVAANDDDVHTLGCATAVLQNESRRNPDPGPRRKYYCGFRTALVGELPVSGVNYLLSYEHDGVPDPSHVDVVLVVTATSKGERKLAKAEAGLAIAEKFGPPVPFICVADLPDEHHPLNKDIHCLIRGLPQFGKSAIAVEAQ